MPLVMAVGKLGAEAYWQWVHRPVPGQPRFFASNALEACSKVEWWIVPVIWLPVSAAAAAMCLGLLGTAPAALLLQQAVGVVLWQALEYSLHRWVFHIHFSSFWGITFHFLLHGNHHKFPMDTQRLVFPPVPAVPIVLAVFLALYLVSGAVAPALGTMSGVLLGYVAYDCLHYAMHHGVKLRGRFLQALKRRHMHHHYHDDTKGYGISSMLFDIVLQTRASLD